MYFFKQSESTIGDDQVTLKIESSPLKSGRYYACLIGYQDHFDQPIDLGSVCGYSKQRYAFDSPLAVNHGFPFSVDSDITSRPLPVNISQISKPNLSVGLGFPYTLNKIVFFDPKGFDSRGYPSKFKLYHTELNTWREIENGERKFLLPIQGARESILLIQERLETLDNNNKLVSINSDLSLSDKLILRDPLLTDQKRFDQIAHYGFDGQFIHLIGQRDRETVHLTINLVT